MNPVLFTKALPIPGAPEAQNFPPCFSVWKGATESRLARQRRSSPRDRELILIHAIALPDGPLGRSFANTATTEMNGCEFLLSSSFRGINDLEALPMVINVLDSFPARSRTSLPT
jgi:hypothetical protein